MDIELPGFDIERELGEGAMATVYLATQRSLQRKVALKVMARRWPPTRASPNASCAKVGPWRGCRTRTR